MCVNLNTAYAPAEWALAFRTLRNGHPLYYWFSIEPNPIRSVQVHKNSKGLVFLIGENDAVERFVDKLVMALNNPHLEIFTEQEYACTGGVYLRISFQLAHHPDVLS